MLSTATVEVTPPVPAGYILTIYRDTPKGLPLVDFSDGSVLNERNLDTLAKQAVFVAAESADRSLYERALVAPVGETVMELPPRAERAGRFAGYDPVGNPTASVLQAVSGFPINSFGPWEAEAPLMDLSQLMAIDPYLIAVLGSLDPEEVESIKSLSAADLAALNGLAGFYDAGTFRVGQRGALESIFQYTEALSQASFKSNNGNYAATFFSQSSDNPNAGSMSTSGGGFFTVNNNTLQKMTTYSIYGEARAYFGAGRSHVAELNQVSLRTPDALYPSDTNAQYNLTEVLRLSSGRGDVSGSLDCSTFITLINNGAKAEKGIVIGEQSISTKVALALPEDYSLSWYYAGSHIKAAQITDKSAYFNVFGTGNYDLQMARGRAGGADVQVGDGLGSISFRARKSGSDIKRAYIYASANTAQGAAVDIMAMNSDGQEVKVTLNGTSNNCFSSNQSGAISLGDGLHPWSSIFALQYFIGGSLRSLTVDSNGFVKAA